MWAICLNSSNQIAFFFSPMTRGTLIIISWLLIIKIRDKGEWERKWWILDSSRLQLLLHRFLNRNHGLVPPGSGNCRFALVTCWIWVVPCSNPRPRYAMKRRGFFLSSFLCVTCLCFTQWMFLYCEWSLRFADIHWHKYMHFFIMAFERDSAQRIVVAVSFFFLTILKQLPLMSVWWQAWSCRGQ